VREGGDRMESWPTTGHVVVTVHEAPVTLAYDTWGEGRPVVLLHGMGSWRRIWRVPPMSGYRFWALDLPGFGDSELPRRRQELSDYAAAVTAAVKTLALSRPIVVGHSFGAMVAVAAARGGLDAAGVVLVAPAGFLKPLNALQPTPSVILNRVLIWLTALDWFGERMAQGLGLDPARLDTASRRDLRHGWRRAREMARMGTFYEYPEMAEDVRRLVAAGTPVRILHGRRDPLFPAERLKPVLADLAVDWWPDVGHVPMLQEPERFRRWLYASLQTIESGGAPA
jgi:pimeloyl-ACP methyl ester carboxylesterase